MSKRYLSWVLAAVFTSGSLAVAPTAAVASSKGRKNTAKVLTGAAAYQVLRGKTKGGIVTGAGAAYAWKRHRDARKAEKRRARVASYRTSYRSHSARSSHRHYHIRGGKRVYHTHAHGPGHHR